LLHILLIDGHIAYEFLLRYNYRMDVFVTGLIVLFVMAAIFYIVVFSFFYYWHLKKVNYIIVPAVFTFEFIAMGFLVISAVSIILNFIPVLVNFFGL